MEINPELLPERGPSLPEIDKVILQIHRLLEWLPRSHPDRSNLLRQLAEGHLSRMSFPDAQSDWDKAIIHLTEAILLPCQPSQVVQIFFRLASALISRFSLSRQPDDIKSSVKYLRFLRSYSHLLEVSHIPRGQLTSTLLLALSRNLVLVSGNMIQEMEEMLDLIPELLTTHVSTYDWMQAIKSFATAVDETGIFRRKDTLQLADRANQILREAMVLKPNLHTSYALAKCLAQRFYTTHMINDYDEAIAIADKIVSTHSPGDSLTTTQIDAIVLISFLLVFRGNLYSKPEYIEDAFHRIRSFMRLPSLVDEDRTHLAGLLNAFARQRFSYLGTIGGSGESIPDPRIVSFPVSYFHVGPIPCLSQELDLRSQMREEARHLQDIEIALMKGEIRDVEAAVERGRKLLPLQRSGDQYGSPERSSQMAFTFAGILVYAHRCTKRSDYLDEAVNTCRDILKLSVSKMLCFHVGHLLLQSLIVRFRLLRLWEDIQEVIALSPGLANDDSGEVLTRFKVSCTWAVVARTTMHPSTSIAYETAVSLLQETLVFSPTLQTQHLRLTHAFSGGTTPGLPSDYVSFQIEKSQFKQAIETLERGRALLWSEMRGFRSSTDQLCAADPALADKFEDINQRLRSVTMSVAQSDDCADRGHDETGTERREHSIGYLVPAQRRLLEERNTLITHIQALPGLENFLQSPSFDVLNAAAAQGPVLIINQSKFSSFILILLNNSPPSVIFTPSYFHSRADRLRGELLRIQKDKGLDTEEYNLTLAHVLTELYYLVGKPVIERLRQLGIPEKSRVWWCPTEDFCSLPLHAM
ncbi:hypothetical protein EI94DRAFT_442733, partial [Lactarius quietus]